MRVAKAAPSILLLGVALLATIATVAGDAHLGLSPSPPPPPSPPEAPPPKPPNPPVPEGGCKATGGTCAHLCEVAILKPTNLPLTTFQPTTASYELPMPDDIRDVGQNWEPSVKLYARTAFPDSVMFGTCSQPGCTLSNPGPVTGEDGAYTYVNYAKCGTKIDILLSVCCPKADGTQWDQEACEASAKAGTDSFQYNFSITNAAPPCAPPGGWSPPPADYPPPAESTARQASAVSATWNLQGLTADTLDEPNFKKAVAGILGEPTTEADVFITGKAAGADGTSADVTFYVALAKGSELTAAALKTQVDDAAAPGNSQTTMALGAAGATALAVKTEAAVGMVKIEAKADGVAMLTPVESHDDSEKSAASATWTLIGVTADSFDEAKFKEAMAATLGAPTEAKDVYVTGTAAADGACASDCAALDVMFSVVLAESSGSLTAVALKDRVKAAAEERSAASQAALTAAGVPATGIAVKAAAVVEAVTIKDGKATKSDSASGSPAAGTPTPAAATPAANIAATPAVEESAAAIATAGVASAVALVLALY